MSHKRNNAKDSGSGISDRVGDRGAPDPEGRDKNQICYDNNDETK